MSPTRERGATVFSASSGVTVSGVRAPFGRESGARTQQRGRPPDASAP